MASDGRIIINGTGSSGNNLIIESLGHKLIIDVGLGRNDILKSVNYKIDDWAACICSHRQSAFGPRKEFGRVY